MPAVARSLAELLRHKGAVRELRLRASPDLVCSNLMCEKVTKPCLCRLERALQAASPLGLEVLDLSGNMLDALPPYVAVLAGSPRTLTVDLSNNLFTRLPAELDKDNTKLRVIMDGNPLTETSKG